MRHFIQPLDGKTLSNNKWAGEVGKMLGTATELEVDPSVAEFSIGERLLQLNDDVIQVM